jgi:hypothetical protein
MAKTNERFKPLKKVKDVNGKVYDFKSKVSVSESGVVFVHPGKRGKSMMTGYITHGRPAGAGHNQISLMTEEGDNALFYVHRLVAYAWLNKPKPHQVEVLHWDDNPKNNHYLNLRWGTHKQNMNDMIRNNKGFKHFLQKYDDSLVYEVYQKKEQGYSISELQTEYKGIITPSSIMHMTSGKMLRDRGLFPKN